MSNLTIDVAAGEISLTYPDGMDAGEALEELERFCREAQAEYVHEHRDAIPPPAMAKQDWSGVMARAPGPLPETTSEGQDVIVESIEKLLIRTDSTTMKVHLCSPLAPDSQVSGFGCPFHVDLRCCHLNAPAELAGHDQLMRHLDKAPPLECPLRAHSVIVEV